MTNIPLEFDLDSTGVWGEPIRQRNTVVINDYQKSSMIHKKGMPHGHVPLTRIFMIPIFLNGEIVGTAGVGNKNEDYTWFDEVQLNLMMEELFAIYYNNDFRIHCTLGLFLLPFGLPTFLLTTFGRSSIPNSTKTSSCLVVSFFGLHSEAGVSLIMTPLLRSFMLDLNDLFSGIRPRRKPSSICTS